MKKIVKVMFVDDKLNQNPSCKELLDDIEKDVNEVLKKEIVNMVMNLAIYGASAIKDTKEDLDKVRAKIIKMRDFKDGV